MSIEYTAEQLKILNSLKDGKNTLITGGAGVGKSFLIKAIRWKLDEMLHKVVFITALTGSAACIIGGSTLHSWAGIGLGDASVEVLAKKILSHRGAKARKRWRCCEVLVIDEVSMLRWDLFEKLNYLGKLIRKDSRPFGGIQVIFVGDFCQLPPIVEGSGGVSGQGSSQGKDSMVKRFCFESDEWDEVVGRTFYMQTNMRQDDIQFQEILGKIRMGECDKEVDKILTARYVATIKAKAGDGTGDIVVNGISATKLFPIRASVDYINSAKLLGLKKNIKKYEMEFKYKERTADEPFGVRDKKEIKDMIDKNSQVGLEVEIAIGAQVMLLYNMDVDAKMVNGSRGVVEAIDEKSGGFPVVRFMNGKKYLIEPHDWIYKHPKGDVLYRQMPLKLAWAISQHKSQGMTLDLVEADIGSSIFEYGQTYTTLSRVRSLEGLFITDYDKLRIKCHPLVKKFYDGMVDDSVKLDKGSIEHYFDITYSSSGSSEGSEGSGEDAPA